MWDNFIVNSTKKLAKNLNYYSLSQDLEFEFILLVTGLYPGPRTTWKILILVLNLVPLQVFN